MNTIVYSRKIHSPNFVHILFKCAICFIRFITLDKHEREILPKILPEIDNTRARETRESRSNGRTEREREREREREKGRERERARKVLRVSEELKPSTFPGLGEGPSSPSCFLRFLWRILAVGQAGAQRSIEKNTHGVRRRAKVYFLFCHELGAYKDTHKA